MKIKFNFISNICLFLLFLLTIGCTTKKISNFSYQMSIYTIEADKKTNMNMTQFLANYNGFVLEFNVGRSFIDTIYHQSRKRTTELKYDTLGLFVLDPQKRMYYEFNSFNDTCKLLKCGSFSQKKIGMALSDTIASIDPKRKPNLNLLRDTFLFNEKILYYKDNIKEINSQQDSVVSFSFFLKNRDFVSLLDLMVPRMFESAYSLVGFSSNYIKLNVTTTGELENMRPLTSHEEKICKNIIKQIQRK